VIASLNQLKSAILGNRRLPKPAAVKPRKPMSPAEARATLGKLATALRVMQAERDASDTAAARLGAMRLAAETKKLGGAFAAGDPLPNLTEIRATAENSALRSRAAYEAAAMSVEGAIQAASDLGSVTTERLNSVRERIRIDTEKKLRDAGLPTYPPNVTMCADTSRDGAALFALATAHAGSLGLPLHQWEKSSFVPAIDGKPAQAAVLHTTLWHWRTAPVHREELEKIGMPRDAFSAVIVADQIDAFVTHSEAVEKFTESLAH
jgi:hypothetical protein